jgi:MHS family proline/betaine transporter-like MFS transporter
MNSSLPTLKSSIAAISGNLIEWYDFALYLFLAPIIAKQFFPEAGRFALLGTFTVYAVSFFFRPLGAIVFGHIGDVYGRALALRWSLSLLAALSIIMALLPGYQTIGVWATVLLCLCRIGQGICLGGEFAGSMIYLGETVKEERRSFYTSLSNNASNLGILLAAGSAALLSYLLPEALFATFGFRILFMLGGLIGVIGFAFRTDLTETQSFTAIAQHVKQPLLFVISQHRQAILQLFLMLIISALGSYAFIGYMSTFLNESLSYSLSVSLRFETLFIGLTLILVPCFAIIADKISPQRMFTYACFAYLVLALPCYYLLYHYQNALFLLPLVIIYSMEQSCVPALLMTFFPASVRYTGVSMTYNTCMALIGGLSPLLGQLFMKNWQMPYGIGGLLMVGAIAALWIVRKCDPVNEVNPAQGFA